LTTPIIQTDALDRTPTSEVQKETPFESLASLCVVIILVIFAQAFIFQNFEIPSGSMEKTLLVGDHVVVDRETFAPPTSWNPSVHYRDIQRGDVIVFFKPTAEDMILVKRAIGLPGDRIHLRNGVLYLNGVAQKEPQISKPSEDHPYDAFRDDFPSVLPDSAQSGIPASWTVDMPNHIQGDDLVVPPGKIFAMGDNRVGSLDGRYWGFVPRENIIGRPMFVYWSFRTPDNQMYKTSMRERIAFMVHIVVHIFDETRWSRTLHRIR
jgi:signal peptidase I